MRKLILVEPNMKSKTVVCAVLALTLSTGGFAFAQGNSDRGDRGERGRQQESRDNDGRQQDRRNNEARQNERRGDENRRDGRGNERRDNDRRDRGGERGAGPNHQFYRGDRLPVEYRHRQYVVDDWRGHQLSAPPRGYHWVQTGGDYVLVAIATGVILQLLLNN
jgi:Ni/Co efflux regulator RcnB